MIFLDGLKNISSNHNKESLFAVVSLSAALFKSFVSMVLFSFLDMVIRFRYRREKMSYQTQIDILEAKYRKMPVLTLRRTRMCDARWDLESFLLP